MSEDVSTLSSKTWGSLKNACTRTSQMCNNHGAPTDWSPISTKCSRAEVYSIVNLWALESITQQGQVS